MLWEISLMRLRANGAQYKVTRRVPSQSIAETRFFQTKRHALRQLHDWLK